MSYSWVLSLFLFKVFRENAKYIMALSNMDLASNYSMVGKGRTIYHIYTHTHMT